MNLALLSILPEFTAPDVKLRRCMCLKISWTIQHPWLLIGALFYTLPNWSVEILATRIAGLRSPPTMPRICHTSLLLHRLFSIFSAPLGCHWSTSLPVTRISCITSMKVEWWSNALIMSISQRFWMFHPTWPVVAHLGLSPIGSIQAFLRTSTSATRSSFHDVSLK